MYTYVYIHTHTYVRTYKYIRRPLWGHLACGGVLKAIPCNPCCPCCPCRSSCHPCCPCCPCWSCWSCRPCFSIVLSREGGEATQAFSPFPSYRLLAATPAPCKSRVQPAGRANSCQERPRSDPRAAKSHPRPPNSDPRAASNPPRPPFPCTPLEPEALFHKMHFGPANTANDRPRATQEAPSAP